MKDWNEIISKNIVEYRKLNKLTQSELAEKLCFSDKSISKWERGEAIPDVVVLINMCEIFGISLNEIIAEHNETVVKPVKITDKRNLLISLLSAGMVWLVATLAFVALLIFVPDFKFSWMAFIYAIPATLIVLLVFACIWGKKWQRFALISALIWSSLISLALSLNIWDFVYIGIPLQVLVVLWFLLLGTMIKKVKNKKTENKFENLNEVE